MMKPYVAQDDLGGERPVEAGGWYGDCLGLMQDPDKDRTQVEAMQWVIDRLWNRLQEFPVTVYPRLEALFSVTIPGEPKAKQRPRARIVGGTYPRPQVYTPNPTEVEERRIAWQLLNEMGSRSLFHGLLRVELDFSRKGRPIDLDNAVKLVLDAANGVVWADDSQVRQLGARITYGASEPQIEMSVWPFFHGDD